MKPYMKIEELADVMGMTPKGVLNSISRGTFPVPTYRLGKARVGPDAGAEEQGSSADDEAVDAEFEEVKEEDK